MGFSFNTVLVLDDLEVPPLQETSHIYQEYVVNGKKLKTEMFYTQTV